MQRFYNSGFWRDLPAAAVPQRRLRRRSTYGTTPPRIPFYWTGSFRQAVTDGIVAIVLGKATVEEDGSKCR